MKTRSIMVPGAIILVFLLFASSATALCVKVSKANLRSGPGKNHEVAWQVYMYMPLDKVGQSTNKLWYAVRDSDGDTYWIHKSLVTGKYRCAVVSVESARVRRGPGTRFSTVKESPARKYYTYRVISSKKGWLKLRDEWGDTGWIRKDLVWIR
ncbi:MAG: SH3 domain-containing protein [Syntrophorhabdaceae bacterium]|nr:SH3 domain-containing protein [Syntrophorhabdaceae bacterium]